MLELNTFSAVIIKLKTSRTTPIYQGSALNQNYRRYNTGTELCGLIFKRTMLLKLYNNHKLISLDDKEDKDYFSGNLLCSLVVTRGRYEVLRGSLQGFPDGCGQIR